MKHHLIFLCFSMLLCLGSLQTKATPASPINPDPVVSNDNRFIWRHTDGRVAIWKVDGASNHLEHRDYGPFAGWTPINYSDNKLLWRHTDGHISLWSFDGGVNQVQFKEQGPFAGWTAVNYADGKILWRHADGHISLWQVNDNGDNVTHKEYGPFPGFTVVNYADNKVLWRHTDGHISIWTMDGGVNYVQFKEYGPYEGWSAVNLADDKVLWRKTDGQISLWSLDNNADKAGNDKIYGPYDGFTIVNYADNKLEWQHVSGKMSLWTLDNDGNMLTAAEFGPFDGWSPVGLDAPAFNASVTNSPENTGSNLTQLLPADRDLVLKWIAEEVAAAKIDYCYRQSYGRGVGEPLSSCNAGTEKNGLLCYPLCQAGYEGKGPVCWQACPSGFTDDHATTCWKPVDYGRGAGRIPDVSCPASHPNMQGIGAAAWCDNGPRFDFWNLSTAAAIVTCRPDEEWNGGFCYPKCKPGYQASGCCLCTIICPEGMTNSGAGCIKQSYGRTAGTPMVCRDGLEQDVALCYPKCDPGYHPVGPVCWQNCPPSQPFECAAGCATSQAACAEKTLDMVITPIQLALNILTLGETSQLTAAKAELTVALKARNFTGAKAAFSRTAKEYVRGFEQLTTKKVAKELKDRFKENAAEWIQAEYANIQVKLAMQESFSEEDLRDLAGLDPTGVAQVVNAFTQKICPGSHPFPTLSRNY